MKRELAVVAGLLAGILVASSGSSSIDAGRARAAGPDPVEVALDFLASSPQARGVVEEDDLVAAGVVPTDHNGLTHVYVQQQHDGIEIFGAIANVAVTRNASVFRNASRLVDAIPNSAVPGIGVIEAAEAAAVALRSEPSSPFEVIESPVGSDRSQILSDGGISLASIPARLVYQPLDETSLRLAWEFGIETTDGRDWWQIRIDASTGAELDRNNLVVHDDFGTPGGHSTEVHASPVSTAPAPAPAPQEAVADGSSYRVYAQPIEAPTFGDRTLVNEPADDNASPFGWHDTNGVPGAESTLTEGNNVSAYTDVDNNDAPDVGSKPDGGAGLDFDFPLDLATGPSAYRPAAVTNLFYWNNIAHDFLYSYGFDEAAGNFQVNNYGNGGLGGDSVNAEAQDGADVACFPFPCRNNANFFTPADGSAPRMQMYVWDAPDPDRDGDLDNGIILHEYGHGLSTRLTGGPSNVACLNNQEQAGEGWSDYVTLMGTMRAGDTATQRRGIGTYALNQPTSGNGIRAFPYSTDMTIDPRTYDSIKTASIPHGVGSTFTAMLWEMTWALIGEYGFDADLANGSGGNNIATQLVIDGMKLQPCSPGFVDARDAILAADLANNSGANTCLLWKAFAKRGLGFSADQGSPASATDGTEAFDLHPECRPLALTKSADVATAQAGGEIRYTLTATNNESAVNQTDVVVTDTLPSGTSFVPGSAQCGGTEAAGVVTFDLGTLTPGQRRACSFNARIDASPWTEYDIDDGFEPGASAWTISNGGGTANWAIDTTIPHTGTNAMFATSPAVVSDQYLTLTTPVPIAATTQLNFWHRYQLEATFDGGIVEISTDGGTTWTNLGPQIIQNGYDGTISSGFSSPIAGEMAFTGTNLTYRETIVDLSSFAGSTAQIRFRVGTDTSVSGQGWWVDDVTLGSVVDVTNVANATSATNTASSQTVVTDVVAPTVPGAPTGVSGVAGNGQVSVSWTAPAVAPGNSVPTGYTVTAAPGAATCTTTGATSCTVNGLTNGTTYTFTVTATNAIGTGPPSAPSSPTTPGASPGAPSAVSAAGNDGSATISWTAPTSDGGFPITAYTVTAAPGAATCTTTGATSCTVNGLTNGTTYTFTVTATNAIGTGPPSAPSSPTTPVATPDSVFVTSLTPARFLDTRSDGTTFDGRFEAAGIRPSGSTLTLDVGGRGDVPPDAKAAVINVTAARATGKGFVTAYPCGVERPVASLLNYTASANIANELVVALPASGDVCLYTNTATHLLADVVGFIPAGSDYVGLTPARLLDTRPSGQTIDDSFAGGAKPAAGNEIELQVGGRGGVPAAARVVIVNVTSIAADERGFVTVHPCLPALPVASSLNYIRATNQANEVIAELDADGKLCVFSSSSTHLALDVVGWLPDGAGYSPVDPARLVDTRPSGDTIDGAFEAEGQRPADSEFVVRVAGRAGVPPGASGAVVNVTAIGAKDRGFITVYDCEGDVPTASSLNHVAGVNIANEVIAGLNSDGALCVYTSRSIHIGLDVVGYTT